MYRGPSHKQREREGWLPGLLAGTAVAGLSDDTIRATALQAALAQPEALSMAGLPLPRVLSRRRRGLECMTGGAGWPGSSSSTTGADLSRRSLPHRALMHAIGGPDFQREIAAARASQQHHSAEQGDARPTEAHLYATMLAELPLQVLSRGQQDAAAGPQLTSVGAQAECSAGSSGIGGQAAGLPAPASEQATCIAAADLCSQSKPTAFCCPKPSVPSCLESALLL